MAAPSEAEIKPNSVEAIWAEVEKFKADPVNYPDYPGHPYGDSDLIDQPPAKPLAHAYGDLNKLLLDWGNTDYVRQAWEQHSKALLEYWLANTQYYLAKLRTASPNVPLSGANLLDIGYTYRLPGGDEIEAWTERRGHPNQKREMFYIKRAYVKGNFTLFNSPDGIDYTNQPEMSYQGFYYPLGPNKVGHWVDFQVSFIRDRITTFKGNVSWHDPSKLNPSIDSKGQELNFRPLVDRMYPDLP